MDEMIRKCPKCGKVIDINKINALKEQLNAIRETTGFMGSVYRASFASIGAFYGDDFTQILQGKIPLVCDCGYTWTTFDEINTRIESIHQTINQTKDNIHLIDGFTEVIRDLGNNDQEKEQELSSLIKDYKNEMISSWTPDENGNCKLQFTKDKDYEDRKVIFIAKSIQDVAGYWDDTHSINYIFTHDCIPSDIKFPLGRPNVNSLYIANPVKPDEYVPYDNYELTLFMDKIRELKRLLRSLGATEITFTSLRGTKIEEAEKVGSSVNAEAGLLGHKVRGGYSSEDGQNRMSSQGIKVDYIERLNSNEYPSLPDRLHWYNSDPEWKDIVEARLHHNQLHFEQSISTKQVSSLNEQSQMNVNAAYEGLISHINVNYHHEREFHVKTTEETMWRITAEFKPLSEFEKDDKTANESQQNLSSDEQKYLDLVKKVSAGGMISELNRKMLEKIRIKLNISEEKAKDLEASLIPQLSEEEKQYLESVRQYLADGIIGENERVLLQTLRELNNISEERASELEAMA